MKKTINISLGGMSFMVEDDAYARLEAYLNKVKAHFAAYADAGEIVSDIESRLAEQLAMSPGEGKIVTLGDVEKLVAVMGEPEQFGEAGGVHGAAEAGGETKILGKRLYRNPDDVIIAGVASGLAAYFGIDSVWVRLAFGLSIFVGGFGAAVYIILWIILPEAKTETEKMQMRGERVNLANIEQLVKERVEEAKGKDRSGLKKGLASSAAAVGGAASGIGRVLGKLIRGAIVLVVKLIGVVLSIAGTIAIIALLFAVVSILINANSSFVDFPFRELAHGEMYYLAMISMFFVAFVPLILLVWLGTSILASRSTFTKMASLSLLGLWVVALIIAGNTVFTFIPRIQDVVRNSPYFQTTTREMDLKDFTKINLSGANQVVLHEAKDFRVVAEGTERDFNFTKIYVDNGALVAKRVNPLPVCFFCWHKPVILQVYMPTLDLVSEDGASRVSGAVPSGGLSDFKLNLSGASSADLSLNVKIMAIELSGASRVNLTGSAETVKLDSSGASHVQADSITIKNVEADLSGASRAEFGDLESLKVEASGASTVVYRSVKSIEKHVSGSSRVVQAPVDPEMPESPETPEAPETPASPMPPLAPEPVK